MRYLNRVTFVKTSGGGYDPVAGENKPMTEIADSIDTNVTDLGAVRSQALFGDYKKKRKVIRLLNTYSHEWDYLYFEGVKYQLASHTDLSRKQSFIVEEMK
jgi:hypothetical protein